MNKNITGNIGRNGSTATTPKQLSFSRLWVEIPHSGRSRPAQKIQNRRAGVSDSRQTDKPESPGSGNEPNKITNADTAQTIPRLRELLNRNWPEAAYGGRNGTAHRFRIHLPDLAAIFPHTGIAYGQLIEISGGISSGKTTLLQKTLAAIEPAPIIGYLDFSCSFFPPGAEAAGIDLQRLKLLRPDTLQNGIRTIEVLLQQRLINCAVFDLVGIHEPLPRILLHRLRQNIIRAEALGFFLTETGSRHLPASYSSLRLQTERAPNDAIEVTAVRSRLGHEGARGRIGRRVNHV